MNSPSAPIPSSPVDVPATAAERVLACPPQGKRAWETPEMIDHGTVGELTQGISFRIGDGINNLS